MRNTWNYCPALNANDHSFLFADTTDLPIKPATISRLPRHCHHEGTLPKFKYEESEHRLFECDMQTIALTYFQCYGCKKGLQKVQQVWLKRFLVGHISQIGNILQECADLATIFREENFCLKIGGISLGISFEHLTKSLNMYSSYFFYIMWYLDVANQNFLT